MKGEGYQMCQGDDRTGREVHSRHIEGKRGRGNSRSDKGEWLDDSGDKVARVNDTGH